MKQSNTPQDSGLWAIGNTVTQDLKDMGLVAALGIAAGLGVAWWHGISPVKFVALLIGA